MDHHHRAACDGGREGTDGSADSGHDSRRDGRVSAGARRDMARISPLPPPSEIFADWLLSVPHDADLEAAARAQIALIDRSTVIHPDLSCLRMLLLALAGDTPPQARSRRY